MNQQDPLSQLRDIHLPEPVSWWPPAPGWWLAGFISLAALIALFYFLRRWRVKNRYRKVALKILSQLDVQDNELTSLEAISELLRRVAIQTFGREKVAALAGEAWLAFLDKTGRTTDFSKGPGRVLGSDLYRPSVEADVEQVQLIARKWIKEHRQC